ncbi:primosomal protein N' (replication factor Y) - superfamily II helicase [Limibaculum sp. M0105]|uniref:Primosomal protein N' (Replication factor Y) -superfamily II helicase n=2 Tax=Thermohalobaculum xanthum TaxID=2753746 RepID=A0A8J7MAC0_9RHOB|nr:primosomal protein N' (replication factor Y) - superfamily II helicase [Thermohalobaculum xanthum]
MPGNDGALPCSNCGARLEYAPGAGALVCPYCGTQNEIPESTDGPWDKGLLREIDLAPALARQGETTEFVETETVRCPGCGAEVGLDAGTIADQCPFCATPLSRQDLHRHRHPRPQGVLPFAVTETEARARMKSWLAGHWFAPSGLKRYAEAGRPLSGVYLPHYTFDAEAEAEYAGFRGDAYYVTQMVTVRGAKGTSTQPRKVRKIRWTPVQGHIARVFDDVLVPASDTLGALSPGPEVFPGWDLEGLRDYTPEFIAGFRAEAPSMGLEQGFAAAGKAMEAALAQDALARIGGDAQRLTRLSAEFDRATFKHVLLPVWLAAYRYRNTPYRVVVNGRTGAVSGERPYSWIKIALAVLAALIVAAVIGAFAAQG